MAKFFVGQRVRMARPVNPVNEGITGRIREIWTRPAMSRDGYVNCSVNWDNGGRDTSERAQCGTATNTDQLEPILDQKHEACEEDFKHSLDELLERQGITA